VNSYVYLPMECLYKHFNLASEHFLYNYRLAYALEIKLKIKNALLTGIYPTPPHLKLTSLSSLVLTKLNSCYLQLLYHSTLRVHLYLLYQVNDQLMKLEKHLCIYQDLLMHSHTQCKQRL